MRPYAIPVSVLAAFVILLGLVSSFPTEVLDTASPSLADISPRNDSLVVNAVDENEDTGDLTTVPCSKIDDFTLDFMLSKMCKRPRAATCLFYTKGLSKHAQFFSKQHSASFTTIWDLWPGKGSTFNYYDARIVKSNSLRCIMQNKENRRLYFSSISRTMAHVCDIFATVMTEDINEIPTAGIWSKVEFPTLKQSSNHLGGKVNKIDVINRDVSKIKTLWLRPGSSNDASAADLAADSAFPLEERGQCGVKGGFIPGTYDIGGEFPVDW